MQLDKQIEALLFVKGEPLDIRQLGKILAVQQEEVEAALGELERALVGRGIVLIRKDNSVALGTHPECATLVETITKEARTGELTKATLETLAIVMYRNPIAKRDIDYIRGVNSQFTLRTLMIRGLIEKVSDEGERQGVAYRPSLDLLSHLGVTKKEDMPDYQTFTQDIKEFFEREERKIANEH